MDDLDRLVWESDLFNAIRVVFLSLMAVCVGVKILKDLSKLYLHYNYSDQAGSAEKKKYKSNSSGPK